MQASVGEGDGSYFKSFAYISSVYLAMQHSCWVNRCRGCLRNDSEQFYENFIVTVTLLPRHGREGRKRKLNSSSLSPELEGNATLQISNGKKDLKFLLQQLCWKYAKKLE